MPADLTDLADRIRKHFDDGCYACGRANPLGLGVDGFRLDGEYLVAEFTPRIEHGGGPGVLHGGIAAAALDEILAWTGMVGEQVFIVTATLEVRYRKPVAIDGSALRLRGRLDDRRGRKLRLSGSLEANGSEAATAYGLYVVVHELDGMFDGDT
ncbi:MAG: PaaI family thioesterase [Acidimicrobiia bacterium]|nr:PaaI family thioesterase [Acidimicrobiia bacterium]